MAYEPDLRRAALESQGVHVTSALNQVSAAVAKSMTWLAVHGYDVVAVTQWLKRRGGHCDCEVLLNVEPKVLGAE